MGFPNLEGCEPGHVNGGKGIADVVDGNAHNKYSHKNVKEQGQFKPHRARGHEWHAQQKDAVFCHQIANYLGNGLDAAHNKNQPAKKCG